MDQSHARSPILTYRYGHHLFTIDPNREVGWQAIEEEWTYFGKPISPPAELRIDGDDLPPLPPGFARTTVNGWDPGAIRSSIVRVISTALDREPRSVTIKKDAEGTVVFEGVGLPGRRVDLVASVELTIEALEKGIDDIMLPVDELPAVVTVEDADLRQQGIEEVVTVGESDFRGSPGPREHNIHVGLARFNGYVIPKDTEFSFDEVLGPVDQKMGYKKELVIKGDKTLPDYGGGLCQVSSTAYRGAWEYGFPIEKRRNHSFAVHYYSPVGTDATIYPPNIDFVFTNDSPGSLLIQTHAEDGLAYFIFYGSRDQRRTDVLGPYTWGHTQAPPDKTEYTTEIPAGTTRKVGERVPGLKAAWFRITDLAVGTGSVMDSFYSTYEARPRFMQIGIDPGEVPAELIPAQDIKPPDDVPDAIIRRRSMQRFRRRE